jgi:perosamine synthetase
MSLEPPLAFFHTAVSRRAVELAMETLSSGWISEGQRVREFEAALAERLSLLRPVALNSGTAALHLGLALAGVGPGDEVILPAQTFVASGLVILMHGATPIFADIDAETGNLDPAGFRSVLSKRTRAVIPVHWAGYPCDLDEINSIAGQHGLAVLEDAAHALGATYRGRPIGAISRFTAFSFQAIKHLTTGDGGALCCRDEGDHAAAVRRRWFGIDRRGAAPSPLGERVYDITEIGYKSHMNDIAAAIGLGNIEDFRERLARRRAVSAQYRQAFAGRPGLTLLRSDGDRESACWLFTMLVEDRERFVRRMADHGVPTSVVHQRIDRNTVFGGVRTELGGQARFDAHQVSLPVHEALTEGDVAHIISAVWSGW